MRHLPAITLGLSFLALGACALDWDVLDPRVGEMGGGTANGGSDPVTGGGPATGGQGGTGGTTSTGGTGGIGGSGGMGGAGGSCGEGGAPGRLVSRGLITRYYLDEAASGSGPITLADAAPDPLDLSITYSGGNAFSETDCHRGMSWPAISLDGRAEAAVLGTKIETALDGSHTGTIECVFELTDADPSSSRISHIGTDITPGRFTMFSDGPMSLGFDWDDQAGLTTLTVAHWTVDLLSLGRVVAHIVLDTTSTTPVDRVRLYVDGVDQGAPDLESSPPELDALTEIIAATDTYVLGNRTVGERSFAGTLYYCAMYSSALTPAEIQQNLAVLTVDDDAP